MKKVIFGLILLTTATLITGSWLRSNESSQDSQVTAPSNQSSEKFNSLITGDNHAALARIPAHYNAAPNPVTMPQTLSPELFTGNERLAYQAAREIPQTLAQLPCYCHCDKSQGHKSLLSCFESEHGENCGICIGEALMAYNLKRQKLDVVEIRRRIVAAYGTPRTQ